jgi:chromate transporter
MTEPARDVAFGEAFRVWLKIGLMSFGGPAGQIALMHRIVVEERKWLSDQQFLNALNFCMLLPGPEAMQLATYSGWRLHGVRGGLAAGLLFVLPGALVVLALAVIYGYFGKLPLIGAVFFGIKAAVLVIVVEALLRISKRALKRTFDWWIAGLAFAALFVFNAPFPLVIVLAGLTGWWLARNAPAQAAPEAVPVRASSTVLTILVWLVIWLAPIGLIAWFTYSDHVLVTVGLFFSKLAVVTFGGAYAVLAYMGQQAVETHGWISASEMIDGLGLAETTPGPLILVTEFVGYLAGFRASGLLGSLSGGLAAAALTLWVTFAPCFLWIFAGAPYVERLQAMPRLSGALTGITAAVVGVILNLTLWFGLHVMFARVGKWTAGPLDMSWPTWASFDWLTVPLVGIAAVLLLRFHAGVPVTLAVSAGLGMVFKLSGL